MPALLVFLQWKLLREKCGCQLEKGGSKPSPHPHPEYQKSQRSLLSVGLEIAGSVLILPAQLLSEDRRQVIY